MNLILNSSPSFQISTQSEYLILTQILQVSILQSERMDKLFEQP
ncbi:hypothetical protein RchiOBHm_Chr6g0264201 [Rosa chinensis]|uniref:Uncharacterized protein n=1 Tax=Rosa chinensis TaxID=74649 RepID=A0A2P6PP47_ROSCH|nr:hypothetical protein RchiOBHm_Chr6g0264201 [Rosa chinensis]